MGFSFRRSASLGPLRVNFSKSGIGVSAGIKGLRIGINARGNTYGRISGAGISYNQTSNRVQQLANGSDQALVDSLVSADLLGFRYDVSKYREADAKGCLKIFVWIVSICLIPMGIGILTTMGLVGYTWYNKRQPQTKFLNAFRDGYSLAAKGDFVNALKFLDKAEDNSPNNIDLIDLKGVCLFQAEIFEKAKKYFEKALQKYPNDYRYKAIIIETLRRMDNTDDYPQIIEFYKQLLDVEPDEDTIFKLGYYLYAIEKYDEAIGYFQKISSDSMLFLKSLYGIADCLYLKSEKKMAIEVLNKAPLRTKKLTDDLVMIFYALATLYEETDNKGLALEYFKRIYLHDINFKDVKQRIDSLENT